MVGSRDTEAERPPLSVILPQLYLGAERDVTQESLASLGISYVLSVSRCSPQPSFLPHSRFLRIPIDDSLWDDLLPWIPQGLRFIDAALSSGASVLVHCAAGISRSPALAVAYVMYSLGMDLDQAYRFVKERRPAISPNFNFLGQLQHFQGALCRGSSGDRSVLQQLDASLSVPIDRADDSETVHGGDRHVHPDENDNQSQTLHLTLNLNQQQAQRPGKDPALSPCEAVKPMQLQFPSSSASLAEKRKSLTLSLTPLADGGSRQDAKTCHSSATAGKSRVKTCENHVGGTHVHGWSSSHSRAEVHEQRVPSPFSCTLNKLLDWGERVLLGGLFFPPVRMGQAALPYRC